jgi:hypothetical protein
MLQSAQTEFKDLTLALQLLLCECAKQTPPVPDYPDRPVFNKARALGLDDYLGHDVGPTVFVDSAAYPTPEVVD